MNLMLPICSRAASWAASKERAGLDGGPQAGINHRGGEAGDRFVLRAVAAEAAFEKGDGVDREVVAAKRRVAGEERVERLTRSAAPAGEGDVRVESAALGRQADADADAL